MEECKTLTEQIPRVVDAVKVSSMRPGEAAAQLDLISASEAFLQVWYFTNGLNLCRKAWDRF